MKRELNDAWLRAVKPPAAGRLEVRDSVVRGLTFRITSGGTASWSVRALGRNGKHTRVNLGTYPGLGLAAARKDALAALTKVQAGGDPVAEKRKARADRAAALAELSVAERLAEWQAVRAADTVRPWSARYAAEVARMVRADIVPKLGKRRLRDTTRQDWAGLIAAKRRTSAASAAWLYRLVSSFLNHAEAAGWIAHPLLPRKGAALLAPPPAARDRALTDAELAEVWQASKAEATKPRAFIRLLALTAAREGEVAGIMPREVDMAAGRWTIPAERTKNGRAITLPLGPLAVAELAAVWGDAPEPDRRLLGALPDSPLQGFSKLKARLDARIAAAREKGGEDPMPPWRWHDLRRTARTGLARLGVPDSIAEACLNHVSARSALVRTYDRHDYGADIVAALLRWQGHLAGLIGEGAEVVALTPRRRARGAE
jgi:integrase